jgi:hypothetical protein
VAIADDEARTDARFFAGFTVEYAYLKYAILILLIDFSGVERERRRGEHPPQEQTGGAQAKTQSTDPHARFGARIGMQHKQVRFTAASGKDHALGHAETHFTRREVSDHHG